MSTISYGACADRFSLQVEELARMNQFFNNLENLYHNKIGTLYDDFNIEIPLRFSEEFSSLWNTETIEAIKGASKVAAEVLNEIRIHPKPYQPKGIAQVKEQVKTIEKAMLGHMIHDFADCACPSFCEEQK
jgi:hypothetical protein